LRVYTAEEVANELGSAKVEYLEPSVEMTSKKKIMVPKLLQWHMKDFADKKLKKLDKKFKVEHKIKEGDQAQQNKELN
ncbi:hypothetical protein Csa_009247, partial [Cucumis sativus]